MKPAPFEYAAPERLADVLDLLAERGDTSSLLAGGQSLVPMLNLRLLRPELVIDLNRLSTLNAVDATDGRIRLGALARLSSLERNAALPEVVHAALRHIGHPQIRNRSTVGGSVAHADPASELPAVVVALDGEIVLTSREGGRVVPAEDFFVGPFTTARKPAELVTEIRLAPPAGGDGVFLEFARRGGDFAVAAVCAVRSGSDVRIAVCGASPAPVRARAAAAAVAAGEPASVAGAAAADEVDPWDDVHASAEYRRHLVATLVARAAEALAA